MEVSNEIKEDIRNTQSDLKNAIRVHQIWVARLRDDEDNVHIKIKVKDAEQDIIAIGQKQKLVVERLRRELELYQQRLKARNKQVHIESDNRYVAQQLRDHQIQYRKRNRSVSLLKPSVLNDLLINGENNNEDTKENISDPESDVKSMLENCNNSENEDKDIYSRSYSQLPSSVNDSRSNFANALQKVKETLIGSKLQQQNNECYDQRSDSDSSGIQHSPTPSPPPLPEPGESVTQETFMRLIGLVTATQRDILKKKMSERKKRSTTSTNRTDFLYGNFDMMPKRKKLNQYPYLQSHHDPPQTRSAKLRKQQNNSHHNNKSSREGSPSGSSSENKEWSGNKPAWAVNLPAGLSVEPVFPASKKVCHGCGRNDVTSLLVWCGSCGVCVHTGCGGGRCLACGAALPEPGAGGRRASDTTADQDYCITEDKLAERKRLQERNIELCEELRKLEARAASLKENLDEHNAEKRQLLADQIKTQRNLQKLLDFISQFKETSISIRSTSVSESGSEVSKSNEE